jgi:hypothetical protein
LSRQLDLERAVHEAGESIIYFLQPDPGGPIKIGVSTRSRLKGRIAALQQASAWPLRVTRTFPGDRKLEARLHRIFREAAMQGEWFYPFRPVCEVAHARYVPEVADG